MFKNRSVNRFEISNIENITLKRCIESIKKYDNGEDTVYLTSSAVCPECCIYDKRIFSVFGKDKRFPYLNNMPQFLKMRQCPSCGIYIGYSMYFSSIKDKKTLNKDIKFSNRPFVDDSPPDILAFRKESDKKNAERIAEGQEFEWISENLPDIAPKSLSGYRRMKNSNTKNYQNIVKKASEKGYVIK